MELISLVQEVVCSSLLKLTIISTLYFDMRKIKEKENKLTSPERTEHSIGFICNEGSVTLQDFMHRLIVSL